MAQHRDVILLIAERRVGLVKIFACQIGEVDVHRTVRGGGVHQCGDSLLRLLKRDFGQDIQKVDERLLGDFRTGDKRGVAKIEVLPIVQNQVGGTRPGCGDYRGNAGQGESCFIFHFLPCRILLPAMRPPHCRKQNHQQEEENLPPPGRTAVSPVAATETTIGM